MLQRIELKLKPHLFQNLAFKGPVLYQYKTSATASVCQMFIYSALKNPKHLLFEQPVVGQNHIVLI